MTTFLNLEDKFMNDNLLSKENMYILKVEKDQTEMQNGKL